MSLPCESPHQTLPSIFLHKVRERIQKESGPPLLNKKVLKFFSLKKKISFGPHQYSDEHLQCDKEMLT